MEGEADRPASAEDGPDEVTLVPGTGVSPRAGASGAGPAPADSSDDLLEGMDEDRIIERAREIEDEVTLASLPVLSVTNPKAPPSHWDTLLKEVMQLAKEFQKERRMHTANARKYAAQLKKEVRNQEKRAEKGSSARVRAKWIAGEVMSFWKDIQSVLTSQYHRELEKRRQAVLQKHLQFLIGETEKYSTALADRLRGEGSPSLGSPDGPSAPRDASMGDANDDGDAGGEGGEDEEEESGAAALAGDDGGAGEGEGSGGEEWEAGAEDADMDDEETLAAEEAMARGEGQGTRDEGGELAAEAEMPIEEILRRYYGGGEGTGGGGGAGEESGSDEDGLEEVRDVEERREVGGSGAGPSGVGVREPVGGDGEEEEVGVAALSDDREGDDGSGDDWQAGAEDADMDDEETLAAEEAMARGEGQGGRDEVGELAAEAELPIEEILRRYYGGGEGEAGEGPGSSGVRDEGLRDASGRETGAGSGVGDGEESKPGRSVRWADEGPSGAGVGAGGGGGEGSRGGSGASVGEAMVDAQRVLGEVPFMVRANLRPYQTEGVSWLVSLSERKLNGILADEMGLGKTLQTIALLAWHASAKGEWGPHLVVVPTSVMLNWEMEFKRWAPGFKILTYFGSVKERKVKRQGWSKPNSFHVCITSYTLALQDARLFLRKKWHFLILDEAHMIKNWRSQRWRTLLNFASKRRLLLTGTPLQNDLMELWSLLHFLMPHIFSSHDQFKSWFLAPLTDIVEAGGADFRDEGIVERLHGVLRPFLLRRLKSEVEKNLPPKFEHLVPCRLSKRQRQLYEDYVASSEARDALQSGSYLSIMNVLMSLRKVCNHPDLFEGRPISSPFWSPPLSLHVPSLAAHALPRGPFAAATVLRDEGWSWADATPPVDVDAVGAAASLDVAQALPPAPDDREPCGGCLATVAGVLPPGAEKVFAQLRMARLSQRPPRTHAPAGTPWQLIRAVLCAGLRETRRLVYARYEGADVDGTGEAGAEEAVAASLGRLRWGREPDAPAWSHSQLLASLVRSPDTCLASILDLVLAFLMVVPRAKSAPPECVVRRPDASAVAAAHGRSLAHARHARTAASFLAPLHSRFQLTFPDKRLIQYDCGKLQELDRLLRQLKAGGHRCLVFTQMTRMLDILELFMNIHGHTYLRLDGATKPEQRQVLMTRFNQDDKYFCFILATRAGGVGVNLTGADTVIFYDSDWNPAIDAQAQDRAHRIGQTREVHIYRLVTKDTVEENILKKSDQKRLLDHLAIQAGAFNVSNVAVAALRGEAPKAAAGRAGLAAGMEVLGKGMGVSDDASDAAVEDEEDRDAAMAQRKAAEEDEAEFQAGSDGEGEGDAVDGEVDGEGEGEKGASTGGGGGRKGGKKGADVAGDEGADGEVKRGAKKRDREEAGVEEGDDGDGGALRPVELLALDWAREAAPWISDAAIDAQIKEYEREEFDMEEIEARRRAMEAEMDADTEGVTIRDWDLAKAKAMAKKSRLTDEALARMAKQVVDFNFRGTSQAGGGRKRMRAAEALSGAAGGMGGVGTRWQKPGRLPRAWPWEVGEDFLLATLATNSGMPHEAIDALWPGAAERLAQLESTVGVGNLGSLAAAIAEWGEAPGSVPRSSQLGAAMEVARKLVPMMGIEWDGGADAPGEAGVAGAEGARVVVKQES